MHKEIILDNYKINYQVFFKNNKHMYLRIKQNSLQITAPNGVNISQIETFITKHKRWIKKRLAQEKVSLYSDKEMYLWGKIYPVMIHQDDFENMVFDRHHMLLSEFNHKIIEGFYHHQLQAEMLSIIEDNQKLLSRYFDLSQLTYKTQLMRSRLGSCHLKKSVIKLNTLLARVDKDYTKLVLFHELCHLVHQNHSKSFHQLLELIYPNHREVNRELTKAIRQFSHKYQPMGA